MMVLLLALNLIACFHAMRLKRKGKSTNCRDAPDDWTDDAGHSCAQFASFSDEHCNFYGGIDFGKGPANEACCACGGGLWRGGSDGDEMDGDDANGQLASNQPGMPQVLEEACNISPFKDRLDQDGTRNCQVQIDVPSKCAGSNSKCALVFAFHGSGGDPENMVRTWSDKLHSGGYAMIAVYPRGASKQGGERGWNVGGSGTFDDKAWVLRIISLMKARGWQGRRYSYGESNGAAISNEIGTNGIMGFSGIATLISQLASDPAKAGPGAYSWTHPVKGQSCTAPLAVLTIGGTEDPVVPYNGGYAEIADVTLYSFDQSNEIWAANNQCHGLAENVVVQAMAWGISYDAEKKTWNCPATTPSIHYKVNGMSHESECTLEGKSEAQIAMEFFADVDMKLDSENKPLVPDLPSGCQQLLP